MDFTVYWNMAQVPGIVSFYPRQSCHSHTDTVNRKLSYNKYRNNINYDNNGNCYGQHWSNVWVSCQFAGFSSTRIHRGDHHWNRNTWRLHDMKTLSVLLALCVAVTYHLLKVYDFLRTVLVNIISLRYLPKKSTYFSWTPIRQSKMPCVARVQLTFQILTSMMTSTNGNIFSITGTFVRGTTSHRWIPLTKASDAELWYFLWSVPEQTVEQTIEAPVIWDAIALIMTSL